MLWQQRDNRLKWIVGNILIKLEIAPDKTHIRSAAWGNNAYAKLDARLLCGVGPAEHNNCWLCLLTSAKRHDIFSSAKGTRPTARAKADARKTSRFYY